MITRPLVTMKKCKTLISIALVAGLACFSFSSCSTVEGFGQDMQKLGEKIEDKSKNVQQEETYDY